METEGANRAWDFLDSDEDSPRGGPCASFPRRRGPGPPGDRARRRGSRTGSQSPPRARAEQAASRPPAEPASTPRPRSIPPISPRPDTAPGSRAWRDALESQRALPSGGGASFPSEAELFLHEMDHDSVSGATHPSDFHVRVTDPEVRSAALDRFVLYSVSGVHPDGTTFNGRKRYSDFEWLRAALLRWLPGVFVPPLPKKQKLGRFEFHFVEARRLGLQRFLERILKRKHIAKFATLKQWLLKTEGPALQQLKQDCVSRSALDGFHDYQVVFSARFNGLRQSDARHSVSPERLGQLKLSLLSHQCYLTELHASVSQAANSNLALELVMDNAKNACRLLHQNESKSLRLEGSAAKKTAFNHPALHPDDADEFVPPPRLSLAKAFCGDAEIRAEDSTMGFGNLRGLLGREKEDTTCMMEAIEYYEKLLNQLQRTREKLSRSEKNLRNAQLGGRSLVASFFGEDVTAHIRTLTVGVNRFREEIRLLEEWVGLARTMLACREIPSFLKTRAEIFNSAVARFARLQRDMSLQLADVWKEFFRDLAASGALRGGVDEEAQEQPETEGTETEATKRDESENVPPDAALGQPATGQSGGEIGSDGGQPAEEPRAKPPDSLWEDR